VKSSSDIFQLLTFDAPDEMQLTRRDTAIEIDGSHVAHAIDSLGRRALVVPLQAGDREVFDTESRGVSLETFSILRGETKHRILIVRCLDPRLENQFGLLVDDVIRSLQQSKIHPGETCLAILHRWRTLFATADSSALSIESQIGLIAELHLFEAIARLDRNAPFRCWRGPDRSRHDFVSLECAVEVKATTKRDQLVIGVHGALQLEPLESLPLYLYVEQLELAPFGDSVTSLVNRIIGLGIEPRRFLSALDKVGFRVQDSSLYAGFTFLTLRTKLCLVDADFPRIVRAVFTAPDMIDRLPRIDYSVDVGPIGGAVEDRFALAVASEMLAKH
jgi:hypothetical protein